MKRHVHNALSFRLQTAVRELGFGDGIVVYISFLFLFPILKILRVFAFLFRFDNSESFEIFVRNSGVQPNAHSFSAVINACAKSGNLVAACEEFDRS